MFTKEQIVVSGSILQNDTNNSGNTLVSREYSKKREEKKGKYREKKKGKPPQNSSRELTEQSRTTASFIKGLGHINIDRTR